MSPNELNELMKQMVGHLSKPDAMYGLFYDTYDSPQS